MATKREARKQRAEEQKESQEQQRRQRRWRFRVLIAAGAVVLLAMAFMVSRRDRGENSGRVWSAAHGHWHDK